MVETKVEKILRLGWPGERVYFVHQSQHGLLDLRSGFLTHGLDHRKMETFLTRLRLQNRLLSPVGVVTAVSGQSEVQELNYSVVDAGIYWNASITERLRLFLDLSLGVTLPDASIAAKPSLAELGGFGAEYFPRLLILPTVDFSFFAELGQAVTGSRADALAGSPFYARGLEGAAGLRIYF